jgi:hypothetical protein
MVQQTQQPYCFGDNDPVNVGDPSGTASLSPASATSYDYSFDLGPLGTPDQVAGFTRFECPVVFLPLRGCTSEFQLGERLNLHESFLWFTQSFPVRVIALSSTSWTFIALPGHPEGPGRTITFSFRYGANQRDIILNVHTSPKGSTFTQWWGLRSLDFWVADLTWKQVATNIRINYEYWAHNGIPGGLPI